MRLRKFAYAVAMVFVLALMTQNILAFAANSGSTGPALAFDASNNRYLMVYTSKAGSGEYEILGQFLNSNGSIQGEAFAVSDTSGADTSAPEIIYDADNDRFVIVWQDGRDDPVQVYCTVLDDEGFVLLDDFVLNSTTEHQLTPGIERNSQNETLLVMWLESPDMDSQTKSFNGVYMDEQDFSKDLLDLTKKDDAISFDITYDEAANQYVLVWDALIGKRTRLNVEYIDDSGDTEKGVTYVSPGDGEIAAPSVEYSTSSDQNLVVWIDEDDAIDDVYTHYATTSGSAVYVLSADEGVDITEVNLVSSGNSDELLMVWSEFDGDSYSVIGNYVNDDGTPTGDESIVIGADSSEPLSTVIAFNSNSDSFLIMQDDGSGTPEPVDSDVSDEETDPGRIEFSNSTSAVEETGAADVSVMRYAGSDGPVQIDYETVYQTAGAGDIVSSQGTLTFEDGVTQQTISIPIVEDDAYEDDEYFDIVLSSPIGGATLGGADTHTVTIQNDDDPYGTLIFTSSAQSVQEGDNISVVVERLEGQNGIVSVEYTMTSDTAAELDYASASGSLTFLSGEDSKIIQIETVQDEETETDEIFTVRLSNPSGGAEIGTQSSQEITILDDDQLSESVSWASDSVYVTEGGQASLKIKRTGLLEAGFTVDYTIEFISADTSDIDFENGQVIFSATDTEKTLNLDTVEDSNLESTEQLKVILETPEIPAYLGNVAEIEVQIYDNDSEVAFSSIHQTLVEGQSTLFTVNRIGKLTESVSVDYRLIGNDADTSDFTNDTGTLTFTSGQDTKTIEVQTLDDDVIEDTEGFSIELFNPVGEVLIGTNASAEILIIDNDVLVNNFNFTQSQVTGVEGESVDIKVLRSGDLTLEQTVDYAVVSDSADTADFNLESGTLSFSADEAIKTISVPYVDDILLESTEQFTVILTNPDDGTEIGSNDTITLIVKDNDMTIGFEKASQSISEGESTEVQVQRKGDLSGTVTVDYETLADSADTDDFVHQTGTLTFQAGESVVTIRVITLDDSEVELSEAFTLVLSNVQASGSLSESDTMYITVEDNDVVTASVSFASSSKSVEEGSYTELIITRSGSLAGELTVDYTFTAGSADTEDYFDMSDTITFSDGEKTKIITLATQEDDLLESIEQYKVILSNPTGDAELGRIDTATVTIIDNDRALDSFSFSEGSQTVTEGDTLTITVERSGDLDTDASVDYLYVTGSADSDDYVEHAGTVIFEAGEDKAPITVQVKEDTEDEDNEYFYLLLYNPSDNAIIGEIETEIIIIENKTHVYDTDDDSNSSRKSSSNSTGRLGEDGTSNDADYARVVSELSEVLITKAKMDQSVSSQSVDVYYAKIDRSLEKIENEAQMRRALKEYIDTVELFSKSELDASWVDMKLIERVQSFTEVTAKISDHEALTEAFIENIRDVEASKQDKSTAELDEAIEDMIDVTLLDVGTISEGYIADTTGDKVAVQFDAQVVYKQVLQELKAFKSLEQVIDSYYGEDNVRDFDFNLTLDVPKYGDQLEIELDKNTLDVIRQSGADAVAVRVEGFAVQLSDEIIHNETETPIERVVIEMDFDRPMPASNGGAVTPQDGYVVDVNSRINDAKVSAFESPVKLMFNMDQFEFDADAYEPDKLSAFRLNDETGVWEPVGGMYDPYTNTLTVYRQSLSQYTVMQTNKTFSDIENSSARAEIEELLGKGVIDETASFDPESNVTREEMATWIARSYGLGDETAEMPFDDVDQDNAHYSELASAYEAGIFSGDSETTFNPEGTVSKEEMAVMLANAMTQFDQKKINENIGGELAQLDDEQLIEDWSADEVALLEELGMLEIEDGQINPDDAVSKELAASIIKKIYG